MTIFYLGLLKSTAQESAKICLSFYTQIKFASGFLTHE